MKDISTSKAMKITIMTAQAILIILIIMVFSALFVDALSEEENRCPDCNISIDMYDGYECINCEENE